VLIILRRFILRMLFTPFWLIVMLIIAFVVLAMMAIAFVSVGCLSFAAVFALGYFVRHDPVAGRKALEALAYSVGSFAFLVAFQGLIWDGISGVWNWGSTPRRSLQLRHSDEDFDENPL